MLFEGPKRELPPLARRLNGAFAHRLRRRLIWIGVVAFVFAATVFPLVFLDSLASTNVLGWPLVAVGSDYEFVGWGYVGNEPRGWISIGFRPVGVVAIGHIPTGVIAVGFVPFGLVSFGHLAFGLLAYGFAAVGLVSCGGASAGWLAFGGTTLGWYARGRAARGAYAWGNYANGLYLTSVIPPKGMPEPATNNSPLAKWRKRIVGSIPEKKTGGAS